MITLNKPYIKNNKGKSRLVFDFKIDKEEKSVWFEVDKEYEKYLCDDRVDAIVVGLLWYAMYNGHDIKGKAKITEELLYKLNEYLIPSLSKNSKVLKNIKIDLETIETCKNAGGVGTGCSCGIDSFHAILRHINKDKSQFNLTHLCINNVGAFNECYSDAGIEKVRKERVKKSIEFAKEINLPIIVTDSNFQQEIKQEHLLTHTYSSSFAILCLQKLWKIYYYGSSGYDYKHFNIIDTEKNDSESYELLSLNCFSTNNLKIYSEGAAYNRLEKTEHIYKNKLFKKYLHVCTREATNCGVCEKCRRTLMMIYCLTDNIDEYKDVFNIEYFKSHKEEYFKWLYDEHRWDSKMNGVTYQELLKSNDEFRKFVEPLEKEAKQNEFDYKTEYEKVINSKTFKIGDTIMKIPRKLKRIVKK